MFDVWSAKRARANIDNADIDQAAITNRDTLCPARPPWFAAMRVRGNDGTEKRMTPMLQWLAQFLTAPIVNGFLDAYKAKLAAANAQGVQAVEVARAALLAEIDARKSANAVILAEQGRWYTAIVRPLLAAPVVIYLWKVIVWDIVLGLGTTDPIGGDVAEWAGWIVTAYVGGRSLEKIARTIWRRP